MDKVKWIKLSQYAKDMGVCYQTAKNRYKAKKINGAIKTDTGRIYVPRDHNVKKHSKFDGKR